MSQALLLVDIQNDFMPAGALPVPRGDEVVPVVNRLMPVFDCVVASQDWHPPGHMSFASSHPGRAPFELTQVDGLEQILWPDHCVQDSNGAGFVADLNTAGIDHVIRKGTDPRIDSYSAFHDNGHRKATGLSEYLQARGVRDVFIAGLAADVCVLYTALDAVREGFTAHVIEDATFGVDIQSGDVERAFADMRAAGVSVLESAQLQV